MLVESVKSRKTVDQRNNYVKKKDSGLVFLIFNFLLCMILGQNFVFGRCILTLTSDVSFLSLYVLICRFFELVH